MYNITFIGTRHAELGECNSNELYKIIDQINPELIFEEIPPSYFDRYYKDKSDKSLESDTINRYLETHQIVHIPVDSEEIPPDSFFKNHEQVLKRVEGLADINGFNYRNSVDTYKLHVAKYGFSYLNSINCINHNDEIFDAIEKGLQKLNNEVFFQTMKLWKDIHEKRENEMLQNIYNYSKQHSYDKAVFTLGAAHRKSIMQKVNEYENKEDFKLNWIFYTNEGISQV